MKNIKLTTKEKLIALFNATKNFNHLEYSPVMLNNNSKLGKNVFDFNLIPIVSCSGKHCTGCYDVQTVIKYGYSLNNTIYRARLINTLYALKNIGLLKNYLIAKITLENAIYKNLIIRIHTGGDFISLEYMQMWYDIASALKDVTFYFYTKEFDKLRKIEFYRLNNVTCFLSMQVVDGVVIVPPSDLQELYPVAWINKSFSDKKYFICPGDCTACGNFCAHNKENTDVLFIGHGNGKKQLEKAINKYSDLLKMKV